MLSREADVVKSENIYDLATLRRLDKTLQTTGTLPKINKLVYQFGSYNGNQIFLTGDGAYFVNTASPISPDIISHVPLTTNDRYANHFLGTHNNLAYFNIAYKGIEIVDINDVSKPKALDLIEDYRLAAFYGDMGISGKAVYDIKDPLKPKVLHKWDIGPFFVIKKSNLLYPTKNGIEVIDLKHDNNFRTTDRITHPMLHDSYLLNLDDDLILARNKNGKGIFLVKVVEERKPEIISSRNDDLDMPGFVSSSNGLLLISPGVSGLINVYRTSEDNLDLIYKFKLAPGAILAGIQANDKYIAISTYTTGGDYRFYVVEHDIDKPLGIIHSEKTKVLTYFHLINDVFYITDNSGVTIHQIK